MEETEESLPQNEESIPENEEPLEENEDSVPEAPVLRRSGRKRIRTSVPEPVRVLNKPVKLTERSSPKDIENYYLDKRVKRLNPSLETIFEEPQIVNNEAVVMSTRKFKRSINFNEVAAKNSAKVKKRQRKAKSRTKKTHKKIPLEFVMQKLQELDE
nr:PREDICTED: proline-rich protein 14 isoform X2 [Tribolium castaneum]XP_008198461.1 PREDICTED: proline-rich protein 14 isoform X2 [Tribolium castaneum]|eukprot:XP_008198460.1 PREDICTED: proline-rich protein 14 isoform X2 [Tribolium castaneum]